MSAETEWRWADPNGQQRLIRQDELRAALANGVIPPNAPVWRSGWKEWQPAHEVPELQTSALAAANGVVPNIPPPPLFVVAAQTAFESAPPPSAGIPKKSGAGEGEPPPPPKYVPAQVKAPPAPPSSQKALSRPPAPTPRTLLEQPTSNPGMNLNVTPPLPSTMQNPAGTTTSPMAAANASASASRPPISVRMTATEALKRAVPASGSKIAVPKTPQAFPTVDTQKDLTTVPSGDKKPNPRAQTVQTVVGVPRLIEAGPVAPAAKPGLTHTPAMPMAVERGQLQPPPQAAVQPQQPGRSTLLFDGTAPTEPLPDDGSNPPIVAPGSGGAQKNQVTRPPPVDPGTVQVGAPRSKFDSAEEISGSLLIENTESGPKVDRIPPVPPKASKPPPPGLRAMASGTPKAISRPPAPPLDGYEGASSKGASGTIIGMETPMPALPMRSSTPPIPLTSKKATPPTPPKASQGAAAPSAGTSGLGGATLLGMAPIPAPAPPPADLMAQVGETPDPGDADDDLEVKRPPPEWLVKVLQRYPQLEQLQKGRPVFFLPVLAGLAALIALLMFGLLIRGCAALFSSGDKAKRRASTNTEEVTPATTGTTTTAPTTEPVAPTTKPTAASTAVCRAGGTAKNLAPKALVPSGVEAIMLGRSIGIGFATSPKEGTALEVDPATLNVTATAKAKGNDIRRVTPILDRGRLFAAADVDKKSDVLVNGRTVAAANPFEIGVKNGQLAWSPHGGSAAAPLWPVDGEAAVEALRVVTDGTGFAVTFRRGGSVFSGLLGAAMKPMGSLQETKGLGTQVGSPTIATSSGALLLMWADRASSEQPWTIRMRNAAANAALADPHEFSPKGGPGSPFIAPSAVGIGGGRFAIVWTEGSGQNHQVRGATLESNGTMVGEPFVLSPPGVNAGQAQIALMPDGRGIVAYLASGADGFEVSAATVNCGGAQ